jgi:hypothetical protein
VRPRGQILRSRARTSYKAEEVVWQAHFADMFERRAPDSLLAIDVSRIHDVMPAA